MRSLQIILIGAAAIAIAALTSCTSASGAGSKTAPTMETLRKADSIYSAANRMAAHRADSMQKAANVVYAYDSRLTGTRLFKIAQEEYRLATKRAKDQYTATTGETPEY